MTKCLTCGYLHHDIQLNCSKCGSFYTEIIVDIEPETSEPETFVTINEIKQPVECVMPSGVNHD